MKYDNDRNRELEFLDTSKELTTKQILKVFDNIYNFNQLDFETQTLIKAFKKLLKVDSSKCGEYTKIFNKYKVLGKKYLIKKLKGNIKIKRKTVKIFTVFCFFTCNLKLYVLYFSVK